MTIKTTLSVMVAASLVFAAGCGKKPDAGASGTPDQGGTAAPAGSGAAAAPGAGGVTTYPNTVPQSGTVRLLQGFTVYAAADRGSAVLTHVSAGQWVNLKGSYSDWMLIDWPSGVGQMSPGWVELRNINDPRITTQKPDAGAAPPPPPPPPPPAVTPPAGTAGVIAPTKKLPPPPPAKPH